MLYLLPWPQEAAQTEEQFILTYDTPILLKQGGANRTEGMLLQSDIQEQLGFTLPLVCGHEERRAISISYDENRAGESYHLHIGAEEITIIGGDKGVRYGVQTLRQIIRQEGAVLSGIEIEDAPDIPNRGFYHDITRGRVPTLETLKKLADTLSFYKINQLQLYVEHSYLFADFSEVWRDDTPLTAEEIMELDRYCQERNIDLVPSLSSFGHLYKLLQTKGYRHLCEREEAIDDEFSFVVRMHHHTLDVSNEESIRLSCRLIDEYMPLFSSGYFNICADETFDLGKGKSKELLAQVGQRRLYTDFLSQICRHVISRGKIPMFWGDIIVGFPEALQDLPPETICLNWGYSPEQREEETRLLAEAGAVQYLCPGTGGWNQLINLMEPSYENIIRMCGYAVKYQALGVLNTDWGDLGHINHPEFSTAGMIFGANFSWNHRVISFAEISKAVSAVEYGDRSGRFIGLLDAMTKQVVFSWTNAVEYKEGRRKWRVEDFEYRKTHAVDSGRVAAANQELRRLIGELYQLLTSLDKDMRQKIKAYLVAADGILIWNETGAALIGTEQERTEQEGTEQEGAEQGKVKKQEKGNNIVLASRLEIWYRQYQELWRSVSKESELYRISELVFWYADQLRQS